MYFRAIERAITAAVTAHEGQVRKGDGGAPYAVHPVHMALILARRGMEESSIVAALLHDTIEDCESWDLERVEREFGEHVARIVDELTEDKTKSWRERKETGIAHIARMSAEAVTIKAVDQLHNLESLRVELEETTDPDGVWSHFRGGRKGTLEIATRKVEALEKRIDPRLSRELRRVLDRLIELAGVEAS